MTNSYFDFDLEIGKGNDGVYAVHARWQGNEAHHEASLPDDDDPTTLRKKIENAVLDSPLRRRRTFSTNEAIVQGFGQKLFDFALNGEALAQLRACQRTAKSLGKQGVRIRLHIFDPELAGLPWEYLYDSRLRDFIALDPTMPIVRYLHHPHAVPPLQVARPLRILAMVASPINLPQLDVAAEKQRVEHAIQTLQEDGSVELVWLQGDSALDLQSALRKGPWHIFHFIGHGEFDVLRDEGYLVLCKRHNKQAEPLYATQLARLLAAQATNLRFVLLNACESGKGSSSDIFSSTAETLINRDIAAVLAMQYSITDDAATLFAQHLYASLAEGLPIDRSVAEARNALALADNQNLEWGVPVLHMRSPDGLLFEVRKPEACTECEMRNAESTDKAIDTLTQADPALPMLQAAKQRQGKALANWQKIGIERVKIAAGDFLFGEDKLKISLPEFCIAKSPVTNQQYFAFVNATNHPAPQHWVEGEIPHGKENHPVVHVSWEDAQAFCSWAGVQLPSEQQWEKAARGNDGREFPWGNEEPDRNRCNFDDNEGDTTAVGTYPATANGLLDMAGNVWEWCEDWYDDARSYRVVRGGAFDNNRYYVCCAYRNGDYSANSWNYSGFRVMIPGGMSV